MIVCRVIGQAVATVKTESLRAVSLMIVQRPADDLAGRRDGDGEPFVAGCSRSPSGATATASSIARSRRRSRAAAREADAASQRPDRRRPSWRILDSLTRRAAERT